MHRIREFMRDTLSKTFLMVRAVLNFQISVNIKENGNRDICQDKVSSLGQMEIDTKEDIKED